jgi:hypothetical protein
MITADCPHPPARLYAWHTTDVRTGRRDWLCVGCCACGTVLQGSAEAYDAYLTEQGATHDAAPTLYQTDPR